MTKTIPLLRHYQIGHASDYTAHGRSVWITADSCWYIFRTANNRWAISACSREELGIIPFSWPCDPTIQERWDMLRRYGLFRPVSFKTKHEAWMALCKMLETVPSEES